MKTTTFEEYQAAYEKSVNDPEGFWADIASNFQWRKPWDKVLDWNFDEPKIEWFKGATMNITENALDRHLAERGDQPAIIWEPNEPDDKAVTITYSQLHRRVCQFANVLKKHGVKKGDRVCIYLPMVPELAIAVLACARIGAIHSVVFGGFSARSIADRINDAACYDGDYVRWCLSGSEGDSDEGNRRRRPRTLPHGEGRDRDDPYPHAGVDAQRP